MSRLVDMTGWKMWEHGVPDNKIEVIKKIPAPENSKSRMAYWECKCHACGTIFSAIGSNIRRNHTKSCGCLRRETSSKVHIKNLLGQTFGLLTVIKYHGIDINSKCALWDCQCKCGNTAIVLGYNLTSYKTISCGCARNSYGEEQIQKILDENNYTYIHDKAYFKDLLSINNKPLRYDFIILENNQPIRLIEFDGPQHEKAYEGFGGEERLKQQQYHDALKNEYAHTHNIPLVRIPYKERDRITLDLLMGDKYLII